MPDIVNDTFTGSNGTSLVAHIGETGALWTQHPNFAQTAQINTNRVFGDAGASIFYSSGGFSSANYTVICDLFVRSNVGADFTGVIGRMSTSATSWYAFLYSGSVFDLRAGISQIGVTSAVALSVGETYRMSLTMNGTAISCQVQRLSDSQYVTAAGGFSATQQDCISVTDNSVTAAGRLGIWLHSASSTNGYHLDSVRGFLLVAGTDFTVDNAAILKSPYNWYTSGSTYTITNNPGAYIRLRFTGTSLAMGVDTAALFNASITALQYPAISYRVDNAWTWTRYQLVAGDSLLALASGLSDTTHDIEINLAAAYWNIDRFGVSSGVDPISALKVTGFTVDNGKTISAPTTQSGRAMFYGDSNYEGLEILGSGATVANQDAVQAVARLVQQLSGYEVGVAAFGSQGWLAGLSAANVGAFRDCWDFYSEGRTRLVGGLFSPQPDAIVIAHGQNDAESGATTTAVTTTLQDIRTAAPSAKIIVVIPHNLNARTQVLAGITASGISNVATIDWGVTVLNGSLGNGTHLNLRGHATTAPTVALAMPATPRGQAQVSSVGMGVASA